MASSEEQVVGGPATDDGFTYPEEDLVDGEALGPEVVDPDPSRVDPELTTSKQLKEEAEEEEKGKKDSGKVKGMEKLKTTLVISGAVVAVIGAVFAIAKKMIREA
ncbi:uncharacterized protein LOC105170024 [Sesamum indicum]|uniref:Uncharacterized protein LOC105170024 n=1 Tax=Sesamum indicum TaxID=4182 RepID=A0A6I9TSY9_SESIN|nr:uncharacterized protein LOC105170024 [Sesamum indicum]